MQVRWKDDNSITFETRTSIRRIFGNKNSRAADWAIFHRAEVQEKKYRDVHGRALQVAEPNSNNRDSRSRKRKPRMIPKPSSISDSSTLDDGTEQQGKIYTTAQLEALVADAIAAYMDKQSANPSK